MQKPLFPFTNANSASQRQRPHTADGQQKQLNLAGLLQMKQEWQPEYRCTMLASTICSTPMMHYGIRENQKRKK